MRIVSFLIFLHVLLVAYSLSVGDELAWNSASTAERSNNGTRGLSPSRTTLRTTLTRRSSQAAGQ